MKKLILMVLILMSCQQPISNDVVILQADVNLMKKNITVLQENLRIANEKLIILSCESKFRHDGIWGDNGRSYGIAQFQKVTFDELKIRAEKPTLSWKSQVDQLWLLDWALRNGYAKKWSCWSGNK